MVAIFSLLMIMKNGKSQKRAEDFTENRKKKPLIQRLFVELGGIERNP